MSQFLTDIDLFNHEIKNFKIDTLSSVPSTLLAGRVVYFNGKYYGGNGSAVKTFAYTSDIPNIGTLTIQKNGEKVNTWKANADGTINITDVASKTALETVQGYFTSGSANTAVKLKTARKLWGNSFDGSADIGGKITFTVPTGVTAPYFEIDEDGNIHTNAGFYSDKFISARGLDDSASGGGGGTSLALVWSSLQNKGGVTEIEIYKDYKIAKAHLPNLGISDITDLSNTITTIQNSIDTINGKIPTDATSENKLADQNWVTTFVNNSISTNTATFRGTYESVADLPNTTTIKDLKNNDYAFVIEVTSSGNPEYARYKYVTGSTPGWQKEYVLNNSSFTSTQWSAINSGITSTLVEKLNGIATGAQVNVIESIQVGTSTLTPSSKKVTISLATGDSAGQIKIAGQNVSVKGWASFLTSIGAGNGISVNENTVAVKLDAASESYLTVGTSGLKLSGINTAISTAVSNADKTSLKCQETTMTDKTSTEISITNGKIKTIKTYLNGVECFCSILLNATDTSKATVSWSGVTLSTTNKLVIKTFYTTS